MTHPTWQHTRPGTDEHKGWVFRRPGDSPLTSPEGKGEFACDGCVPDPLHAVTSVRDLYDIAVASEERRQGSPRAAPAKFTVPVLWDSKEETIVRCRAKPPYFLLPESHPPKAEFDIATR